MQAFQVFDEGGHGMAEDLPGEKPGHVFPKQVFLGRVLVKKSSLLHGPSNTVFYNSLSNSALVLPKKLPTQAF